MLTAQLQLQQVKLFQDSIPVKEDLFILALLFIRGLPQMYELQVWTHIVCIFEKKFNMRLSLSRQETNTETERKLL